MNLRLDRCNIELYYGAILREAQSSFIGWLGWAGERIPQTVSFWKKSNKSYFKMADYSVLNASLVSY